MTGAPRRGGLVLAASVAGLFALALLARVVFLREYSTWPLYDRFGPIVDSRFYLLRAQQIAAGQWRDAAPFYLSPFYSYVLGLLFHFVEASQRSARALQTVLGAGSCALVFVGARRVFGQRVALVAGALMALNGVLLYYTAVVLPSTLVLFLHAALLAVLAGHDERPGLGRCLAAGLLLGLAAATKPNALLTAALVAVYLAARSGAPGIAARLRPVAVLVAGVVIAVAPCTWHNFAVSGDFVLVSTNGGRNLYKGNGPEATGAHVFLSGDSGIALPDYLKGEVDPHAPVSESRRLSARTWEHVRTHPLDAAALLGKKLMLALHQRELGVRDNVTFAERYSGLLRVSPLGFGVLASLGLVGLFVARDRPGSGLFAVLVAAQLASLVLVFVLARYRVVLIACLSVYAVHFCAWCLARWRARDRRALAAGIAAVLVLLVATHWPLRGHPREAGFALQHYALAKAHLGEQRWEAARTAALAAAAGDWLGLPTERTKRLECRLDAAQAALELGRTDQAHRELDALRIDVQREGREDPARRRLQARVEELRDR